MTMVNIHAAKTHFSRLIDQAAAGEEIVIARAGKPVARIVPLEAPKPPRMLGLLKGSLVIPDDFDAPLPDDVLALFEGE
jgi:prevent-host-death family protein